MFYFSESKKELLQKKGLRINGEINDIKFIE